MTVPLWINFFASFYSGFGIEHETDENYQNKKWWKAHFFLFFLIFFLWLLWPLAIIYQKFRQFSDCSSGTSSWVVELCSLCRMMNDLWVFCYGVAMYSSTILSAVVVMASNVFCLCCVLLDAWTHMIWPLFLQGKLSEEKLEVVTLYAHWFHDVATRWVALRNLCRLAVDVMICFPLYFTEFTKMVFPESQSTSRMWK